MMLKKISNFDFFDFLRIQKGYKSVPKIIIYIDGAKKIQRQALSKNLILAYLGENFVLSFFMPKRR